MFSILDRLGYFDGKIVRYQLKDNYCVLVPTKNSDRWDLEDLLHYEEELVGALVAEASKCVGPITLVDCGADIGLVSVVLAAKLDQVTKLVSFEPSDVAFSILKETLAGLPIDAEAIHKGVSDFTGRGELRSPSYDTDAHARYVVQVEEGGFEVMTVDALGLKTVNLLFKIDVEGQEIGVICGAAQTVAGAERAIISIEAHPKVFGRTGIDPIKILQAIAAIRPFKFTVAETGTSDLDLSRPFFEQLPNDGTSYNIVCSSL